MTHYLTKFGKQNELTQGMNISYHYEEDSIEVSEVEKL